MNWMSRAAAYSYEENVKDALALSELMLTLKYLKKPTIARVQGPAFGGGVGLIACCDIAIASEEALFALSEVKIGLVPAVISPYVISLIGERAARRYFLTGERFNAQTALQLGLLTEVTTPAELDSTVKKMAINLLTNGPQAVLATKELINRICVMPYDEKHRQQNAELIAAIRGSAEGKEGLAAFLEKRTAKWQK